MSILYPSYPDFTLLQLLFDGTTGNQTQGIIHCKKSISRCAKADESAIIYINYQK
jgi:hypothetical protein